MMDFLNKAKCELENIELSNEKESKLITKSFKIQSEDCVEIKKGL